MIVNEHLVSHLYFFFPDAVLFFSFFFPKSAVFLIWLNLSVQKNRNCVVKISNGISSALEIKNILVALGQIGQLILVTGRLLERIGLSFITLVQLG